MSETEVPGTPNPATSPEGIEYGHIFATFTEGGEDLSIDLDPYPNERWLTGTVKLRPSFDGRSTNASLTVPATPRSRGMVISELSFEIVSSKLVDNQGREGVWVIIKAAELPVYWSAQVTLKSSDGRVVLNQTYFLGANTWVTEPDGIRTANLPDLIPRPGTITPPEGAAVISAQSAMYRALQVASVLESALPAINSAEENANSADVDAGRAELAAERAEHLSVAQDSAIQATITGPSGSRDFLDATYAEVSYVDGLVALVASRLDGAAQQAAAAAGPAAVTAANQAVSDAVANLDPIVRWNKRPLTANDDLSTLPPGLYSLNSSSVATALGFPATFSGDVELKWLTSNGSVKRIDYSPQTNGRYHKFSRWCVNNAWDPWTTVSVLGNALYSGDDVNNVKDTARHPVMSGVVANLPETAVGTLVSDAVASYVFHEFISENRNRWDRVFKSGSWSAWKLLGSASGGGTPSETAAPIYLGRSSGSPYGAGVFLRDATFENKTSGSYPTSSSNDRTVFFNGDSSYVSQSVDGVNWTIITNMQEPATWTRQMSDGQLLSFVGTGQSEPRRLKRSKGYGTGTVTWDTVLTLSQPILTLGSWSVDVYGDRILIAEYGSKEPSVEAGKWPRFVYQSLDGGRTFAEILDLAAILSGLGRTTHTGQHLHGVCYDPFWNRIWVSWGDDTNGIVVSDDNGQTWTTVLYGDTPNADWQGVGMLALPECILFGSDSAPNGVWRIDRKQGKTPSGGRYVPEVAFSINDEKTNRTHLCHALHRVPGANGKPDLILAGFSAESNPGESIVVGTWDGWGWSTMYRHPEKHPAGQGLRTITTGVDGTVYIGLQTSEGRHLVKGTSWTVARQANPN